MYVYVCYRRPLGHSATTVLKSNCFVKCGFLMSNNARAERKINTKWWRTTQVERQQTLNGLLRSWICHAEVYSSLCPLPSLSCSTPWNTCGYYISVLSQLSHWPQWCYCCLCITFCVLFSLLILKNYLLIVVWVGNSCFSLKVLCESFLLSLCMVLLNVLQLFVFLRNLSLSCGWDLRRKYVFNSFYFLFVNNS